MILQRGSYDSMRPMGLNDVASCTIRARLSPPYPNLKSPPEWSRPTMNTVSVPASGFTKPR